MLNNLCFMNFIENYKCAYVVADFKVGKIVYANKMAHSLYGITTDTPDLEPIFANHSKGIFSMFQEDMKTRGDGDVLIPDVKTLRADGELQFSDLHLGYFNREESQVFMEIMPKLYNPLSVLHKFIDNSTKHILILNIDEQLSINYCSKKTKDLYLIQDNAVFADTFLPEEKETQLKRIHDFFQANTTEAYYTHIQVRRNKGEKLWYALHLECIEVRPDSKKLICTMNCIQDHITMQQELDDVNQYFNILQSMCKGLLYRFDIETRTLYRNEEMARTYNVPSVTNDFPPREWLERVMHPEDIVAYEQFIDSVVAGQDGELTSRFLTPQGNLEYHKFTFKAVRRSDGTIKEMVGCAMNVHNLTETQKELKHVSQYFSVLQSLTKGLLYRFDIKNRILYRNEETADYYHIPTKAENYPDPEKLKGIFHSDDIADYVTFIEHVTKGGEGSHLARLISPSGQYEYHKITFKALKKSDGTIKEMIGNAVNIQKLKDTEFQLSTTNQYFDILQSFSKDLLYRLNIKTRTLYRNENTSAYYGIPPVVENYPNYENLKGVFHPEDIDHYVHFIEDVLQGKECTHTARLISPSGNFEYHKFTFKQMKKQDGTVDEMVGHAVNIQSLMELETKASYDMLTNCLNKISFQEQVSHVLKHASLQTRHALFFIDLDDFKGINDNLGHSFGDFLLQTVGSRLKKLVRENDLVGRVGGDEFVLFLESCGDDMHLEKRGLQILETLREEYLQNTTSATIKGSVGVAVYPHHGSNYETLYNHADKALYHSKHLGKDVVTIYYNGLGDSSTPQ